MLVHAGKYGTTQIKNTDNTQTKHNLEKANNTKHSKPKLAWFSCLIRQSARKRGELIVKHFRAHKGLGEPLQTALL